MAANDMHSLAEAPVLIVEDEAFIAIGLQAAVESAGGQVIGPAASVVEAMELLKTATVAAAILDINLSDGMVTPVVEALMARNVPMVFQSGVDLPPELKRKCPDAAVYRKPAAAPLLVAELTKLIRS
jgi:DNA-binding NarL/FixJ family response regulator